MKLSILLTGRLRGFFQRSNIISQLKELITLSKFEYDSIILFFVINEEFNKDEIDIFCKELKVEYVLIDYNPLLKIHYENCSKKIELTAYQELRDRYLSHDNNAKKEILDIDNYIKNAYIQFHQLQVGIDTILEYEKNKSITFDVIIKSRFDVQFVKHFYPRLSSDSNIWRKICLTDDIYTRLVKNMTDYSIEPTIDSLIDFLTKQEIKLPACRINFDLSDLVFGGSYYYNYISLQNIKNGSNNILYTYNDYFIFGNRNTFIKLRELEEQSVIKDCLIKFPHFYAPEAQLNIFCINNNIDIIMYPHTTRTGITMMPEWP